MTESLLNRYRQRHAEYLELVLPAASLGSGDSLSAAIRYAALSGGKRLRPLLVYASGDALGIQPEQLDRAALAVELIHCYSLIHDDLPAMDDDDLRRGQATVHKAFNEATAILAGDALQTMAFDLLIQQTAVSDTSKIQALQILTKAALDMVKGQALDIAYEGLQPEQTQLEEMLQLKTGALISASTLIATAFAENLTESKCLALADYAEAIGLAFQIRDDVLDVTGNSEIMGKPQGSDAELDKATWPARFGVKQAHVRTGQLYERAIIALEHFDESADLLRDLAEQMVIRDH
ncbi:MAG: polyprenyl synthetase family protein [Xanthomonadales bacterium]|nr:polyprenyl synthetase family protein [Xanthomonadales bacterium]